MLYAPGIPHVTLRSTGYQPYRYRYHDVRGLELFIAYVSIAPRRKVAGERLRLAVFFLSGFAGGNILGENTTVPVLRLFGGEQRYVFFEGPPQEY